MSEHSTSAYEDSDDDDWYLWELEAIARVPDLPYEVQTQIVQFCDLRSLAVLCKISKEWRRRALPTLWRHLDFTDAFGDYEREEAVRMFFLRCNEMMDRDLEGFAELASNVRSLDVGRMIGINIDPDNDSFQWVDHCSDEERRCVFDVIAHFKNLELLSIYVKNWWGSHFDRGDAGQALASNLKKLRFLTVGGQVPPLVLEGLSRLGPQLKNLTLINLISRAGQDDGPDPVTFLSEETCAGFTSLETLHLCKLADLDGRLEYRQPNYDEDDQDGYDKDYASGMRWPFPREGEVDVLDEWARLLRHTSKTLRSLTLENRYLCSYGWGSYQSKFIEPGNGHPEDYGAVSIRESQRVLFPVLFNEDWAGLEELILVGMGKGEAVSEAVAHLKDRVRIEQLPSRYQLMGGDSTPEEISTPYEFL